MENDAKPSWIDQLEVTGPIKALMGFVDELSSNYDRRIAALHIDHQKDVEDILACYKNEKQEFQTLIQQQQQTIEELQRELQALQHTNNTLSVEYKMTQDCLETTKQEITTLTTVLKREEELVDIAAQRIRTANEQIKLELAGRGVAPVAATIVADKPITTRPITAAIISTKKSRMRKTREFFQQVFGNRLSKPIILRRQEPTNLSEPIKQDPIMSDSFSDQDTHPY